MAEKKYFVNINLNGNQIIGGAVEASATEVTGISEGQMYYNTTDNSLYLYDGSSWSISSALLSGDIVTDSSGNATIQLLSIENGMLENSVVTNSKLAVMAINTIKGSTTGISDPIDLTTAQTRSMLNIEDGATADQSDAEIKIAYENNADTNEFSDAEQTKLADIESSVQTLTNKTLADHSNDIHANRVHFKVKATENINKGQPVVITGYNVGEAALEMALANNTVGVATGLSEFTLFNGEFGGVVSTGLLEDWDTSSFSEGAILYVDGAGVLTESEPLVGFAQPIAYVLRSNAVNGAVQVNADYPKQDSDDVRVLTTNFINNLSNTDDSVQKALETLDQIIIGAVSFIDITWASLVALGSWESMALYNIIDAHPDSGIVYGRIQILSAVTPNKFQHIDLNNIIQIITIQ